MQFIDTVVLDGVRKTRDGYLVASAKTARTGIQIYSGRDIDPDNKHGLRDRAEVRVYRSPDEVFHKDAMASMAHRPVTVDHPAEMVDATNWRKHSVGITGDEVARDGDFVRVPLTLMDQQAIDAYEAGKRELSWGYTCDIDFTDGVTPEGEAFDAAQRTIRANHLATCRNARGGPDLRLGDQTPKETPMATKTITFDGVPIEVTDAGEAAIVKLQGQLATLATAKDEADKSVAELTTAGATKDAEITTLKKAVEDAKVTPAQMRDAAKAYARTLTDAKLLAPAVTLGDELDEAAIKRAVVSSKLGDAAKGWTDAQVDVSFNTLAAGLTDEQRQASPDPLRDAIAQGGGNLQDGDKAVNDARAAMLADLHAGKAGAAAA
jgi:hypothetical protein